MSSRQIITLSPISNARFSLFNSSRAAAFGASPGSSDVTRCPIARPAAARAVSACRASVLPAPDPLTRLSPAATVADIALFRRSTEEGHAALYRYRTRADIQAKFAELEARAQNGLTPVELWRHLSEFSAFVADAHLQVHPSQAMYDRIFEENLLPINLAFRNGRCEVAESVTSDVPNGAEVISIAGYRCDQIPQTFGELIPADGRTIARKRFVLDRDFPVFLAMLGRFERKIPLEFRSSQDGPSRQVVIDTISYDRKQTLRGKSPAAGGSSPYDHSLKFVGDDTAVMHVKSFEKTPSGSKRRFASMKAAMFAAG